MTDILYYLVRKSYKIIFTVKVVSFIVRDFYNTGTIFCISHNIEYRKIRSTDVHTNLRIIFTVFSDICNKDIENVRDTCDKFLVIRCERVCDFLLL